MSEPFIGEIRMFAGNFAPVGWTFCNGQTVSIPENDALYNLIGTTYGGDGVSNFALPNLSGRVPIHIGTGGGASYGLGANGGFEQITLTPGQLPLHTHAMPAAGADADSKLPDMSLLANTTGTATPYFNATPANALASAAISTNGGGLPHDNLQPYLCVNFIIAMNGIYPSQP